MLPAQHEVLILVYVLARETWHGSTEVRHRRLTIVDQVAHEKLISRAQYFVDAKDSVIFAGGLQQGSREQRQSAAESRTIRQWIERQQRGGPDVNSHENKLPLSVWQEPIVHVGVRHGKTVRDALTLTQSFVVDEEECLVVNDGPAKTGAELVANIPRFAYIKKVAGIEHGIADKFVSPTMPVIRTRFRYVLFVMVGRVPLAATFVILPSENGLGPAFVTGATPTCNWISCERSRPLRGNCVSVCSVTTPLT